MDTVDRVPLPDQGHAPRNAAIGVWQGAKAVARGLTFLPRALLRWWRRSIQARVVIGVLSLSTVLAVLAGWVLLHQVKDGLLVSQRQTALPQAAAGFDAARDSLNEQSVTATCGSASTGFCQSFDTVVANLVETLGPHQAASNSFAVVVIGPLITVDPERVDTWNAYYPSAVDLGSSIPADLVATTKASGGTWWTYAGLRRTPDSASQPALVVARQIDVSALDRQYGILYVFPLAEQQQTLSVVERGLLGAGAILVLLLGTIAWLVTRQVVTPVRLARRIAERLAAGRLEERMHVRGEDDIARLAKSFNHMANGLQRQIRQLEELSRVQRRFVADVSHELRTPLTTVRMASDLLYEARADFDAPTGRSAELLQNELNRFETLLTDLLEISRFDAGAAVLEVGHVDVAEVARQIVDAHTPLAQTRGSTIWLTLPEEPAVVEADVRRINRVVRNLVANAVQYGEGNDIDLTVTAEESMVTLVVLDHGLGLKPGEESLVFNRFWRADPARAKTRGGTGLGLSIAAEDTVLHGGVLEAWGRPGVGAVFRLVLPRHVGGRIRPRPLPLPEDELALAGGAAVRQLTDGSAER